MAMGLRPLDPAHWIEPDIEWEEFYKHKLQCFTEKPEKCLLMQEDSMDAQDELRKMLKQHLLTDYSEHFRISGSDVIHQPSRTTIRSNNGPPIAEAALWVQDDLCLLEDSPEGYRLTAAALCSPSYWHLEDKIGQTLDSIHTPVPDYQNQLSKPVNHFFSKLKPGRPVWRMNWSVTAHKGLMQRLDPPTPGDVDHDPLWLRVERQTLTRLPNTHSVCFTIRIHRYPLNDVLAKPSTAKAFHNAIDQLTPEETAYKSLSKVRHRL